MNKEALSKEASRVGAYFASGAIPREYTNDHPVGLGLLAGVPYAGSLASSVGADVASGLEAKENDPFKRLNSESYGQTAVRRGTSGVKFGLGAGLVTALLGAGLNRFGGNADTRQLGDGLMLGGAMLPAASGIFGGLTGAYDKFVADHTSKDSQRAARSMKADHPLSTALPFGDAVGAAVYGGKPNRMKQAAHTMHDPFSNESPSFPTFFGSDEFAGHQAKRQAALKPLLTSPSMKQRLGLLLAGGRKNYRHKQWKPQPETSAMADQLNDLYTRDQMHRAGIHQPNSRGKPTPVTMNAQDAAALKHLMSLYASGGEFDFKKKADCTTHDPNTPESFDNSQKPIVIKSRQKAKFTVEKKAYVMGFVKAATAAGLSTGQAVDLLYRAGNLR